MRAEAGQRARAREEKTGDQVSPKCICSGRAGRSSEMDDVPPGERFRIESDAFVVIF